MSARGQMGSTLVAIVVSAAFGVGPAAAAPGKKAKAKPPSIALVELEGLAPAADKQAVDDELRALLPDAGYVVQKRDRTQATLVTVKKLGLACDSGDVDCLIRVGALGGVNVVLKGLLSVEGEAFALDLVAADVNGLRERGRVRVSVPKDGGPARRAALDGALVGVLRSEAWRGQLRVTVAQRGASIVVDGVPRGFAPLSTPIDLVPGPHAVFVGLEGYRAHKEQVEVRYDDETALDVALAPGASEEPPSFSTVVSPPEPPPVPIEAPAPKPARKRPLRVVMYDVDASGVPPRTASVLGALLVAEVRKREGVSVLDSGELRALVGDGATTAGDVRGCTEDQCFAEVAEALGADAVVVSQLTQVEGMVLFGLRRIDQQRQEVTASFLERVSAEDSGALLPLVGKAVGVAFADAPLRPGQTAGVDERAAQRLNPPPLPPSVAGSLYVGAGVAGAVGAVSGAVAMTAAVAYLDEFGKATPNNDVLAPQQQAYNTSGAIALAAVSSALVLGGAALLTSPLTDWDGYGQERSEP